MSVFKWTVKREAAALMLAQGYTEAETAAQVGVADRTIRRWKTELEFSVEVDRLSLMVGIASRAERLRIAMQVIRQKTAEDGRLRTSRDLLDWVKFAQSETDGVKLDLTTLLETAASVAGAGSAGADSACHACDDCTCMAPAQEQRDGEGV